MFRKTLALAFLLCVAVFGYAELKVTGETTVAAHKMVRLTVTGADDAALIWDFDKEDLIDVEEEGNRLLFTGPPGTYKLKCRAVRVKDSKASVETVRVTVVIGKGVPPKPDPDIKPTPDPVPVVGSIWILVIEETSMASDSRGRFFSNAALAARLKAKSHKYRVVDKDVVGPDGRPPRDLAPWLEKAKAKTLPALWLINSAGDVLFEGDMVRTPQDLIKILDKIGG